MAIPYPTSPPFKAVNLRMIDPSIIFRSQSGKRIVRKVSGQYWMFTLKYPPKKRSEFSAVIGALAKAQGQYQTFAIIPPNLATPEGTQLSDTTVQNTVSAGNVSVNLQGASAGATFKAGDVVKFSNHTKVYMITDDATADGGGLATIFINPPLLESLPATTTTAKHSNVPFNVSLSGSVQEINTDVAGFYFYELDVEEVF